MVKLGKGIQLKIAEMGQDHREREERKKAACRMKLRLIRSLLSDSGGLRISRSLETFLPGDLGILTFGSFLKHVEESETSFIYQKKTRDNRDLIISSSSISLRDSIALYTAMITDQESNFKRRKCQKEEPYKSDGGDYFLKVPGHRFAPRFGVSFADLEQSRSSETWCG